MASSVTNDDVKYCITGIIRGRKVLRIAFFAVVREKTFVIQVISLYKNSSRDRKCKKTFANASDLRNSRNFSSTNDSCYTVLLIEGILVVI